MTSYENIQQLNQQFTQKNINEIPSTITIGDITFSVRDSLFPQNMVNLNSGRSLVQLYTAKGGSSNERLALVWQMKQGLIIHPILAKLIKKFRGSSDSSVMHEAATKQDQEPAIGTQIEIEIASLNNHKLIIGKVDTGASVCSLHADNIQVKKDPLDPEQSIVKFTIDDTTYSMNIEQQQSIQTADGGVEYRPLVKFNVVYDGRTFHDVMFNLNDRSQMDEKLLVGLNLLADIGYKIDPTQESVSDDDSVITEYEWQWIVNQIDSDLEFIHLTEDTTDRTLEIQSLYETLINQNISFSDLLRFVKLQTIQTIDHLE